MGVFEWTTFAVISAVALKKVRDQKIKKRTQKVSQCQLTPSEEPECSNVSQGIIPKRLIPCLKPIPDPPTPLTCFEELLSVVHSGLSRGKVPDEGASNGRPGPFQAPYRASPSPWRGRQQSRRHPMDPAPRARSSRRCDR